MTYPADVHGTLKVAWQHPPAADPELFRVTFEEYGTDGPGIKPRTFPTAEALREFVRVDIGASTEAFERLLSDLRTTGTAEIFDVVLAVADLGRLGFE
jgi:hypothetical protein